jgi:cytochrome c oxidase subunit 1
MSDRATSSPAAGYLGGTKGVGAWFTSLDHKRIGMMFLGWTLGALLLGIIFSIITTTKSLGGRGLEAGFIYRVLTYQRVFLVFLFMVPAVPSVLGHFLLPLQLGARNMALPALSRGSLWFYVIGLVLILVSIVIGPVATGWTLDSSLFLQDPGAAIVLGVGLLFLALSWFFTGINFLVTVHHRRIPGMGFFAMPILAWSLYLSGYLLAGAGIVFAIIVLYLLASRAFGGGMFGADADPLLWKNYFWFAMRPAVFCALIPGVGVVSEIVTSLARKPLAGYRSLVGSLIALTGLAFVSWGAHLVGQGQDPGLTLVFSAFSLLAAVPVALIAYIWLATLYRGANDRSAAGVFVWGFFLQAGIAVMMSLFLASPVVGSYLGATMFVSTQLDFLIWGGALTALLAGLHFWWPKMTGRPFNDEVARIGAVLFVIGVNLALVPYLILGMRGVPQDMGAFVPGPAGLNELAALGWLVALAGIGVVVSNLISTLWSTEQAEANPWGSTTLEWSAPSPPPEDNFTSTPEVGGLYRY